MTITAIILNVLIILAFIAVIYVLVGGTFR